MGPGMYDKFGLLNGQAWPRPNPWYAPNHPGMPSLGHMGTHAQYQTPTPITSPVEKKGKNY